MTLVQDIVRLRKRHVGLARYFRVNQGHCENPKHYEQFLSYCAYGDTKMG